MFSTITSGEIRQALEEGSGQGKHLSNTLLQKNLYYAARLSDGTVLRISCVETTVGALILGVLQPVLWILVLALILSGILASRLSRQITKPINSLDLENPRLDETYEELFPLVSRLREQNRTIGRQMDALGRRQREFAALAENMSEGVLLIDSRYHVLSGNQSAFHLLGEKQQPESIRQGTCRREIWEAAGKALAGRHAETLMRGESHIFEILASPVTANGQVTGAVILMVDVTEREERESLRREFSANVSHELKTPVTILKGQLQGMLYGVGGYKDRDKYLKRAFEVTCAMENLVMEILTVSRMKSSGFSLQPEAIRLTDFAAGILDSHGELLNEKGIDVVMEADGSDPLIIQADKRLFAKVLSNLISNACHYSPAGEEIRIQIAKADDAVGFSIENTGVHIPEEEIPGLFEPFTRGEPSRNRETGGSGLGLFIVRMVLELHHFSYRLENTDDGVRFSIIFAVP